MGLTLDLPADLAADLTDEAARQGLSLPEYAVRVLTARPAVGSISSGADLVAYWKAEGLIGTRPDITDSQTHARALRDAAQGCSPI